jgi:hypothetical protein
MNSTSAEYESQIDSHEEKALPVFSTQADIDVKTANTKEPAYSILPKKLYNVIGLEASGTHFVTNLIKDALHVKQIREGSFSLDSSHDHDEIQVQHFSYPWGGFCEDLRFKEVPIVDVVLPSQCTRRGNVPSECSQMTKDLWGFELPASKGVSYPGRYNLNIMRQKEWYEEQGVEFYLIIVLRDETISREGRKHARHCRTESLLLKEENASKKLIIEAINKYVINGNDDHPITSETFDTWVPYKYQSYSHRHNYNNMRRKLSSAIPNNNNVILVSYESFELLQELYVKMLYDALGIESDYMPKIVDGNSKYVNKNLH